MQEFNMVGSYTRDFKKHKTVKIGGRVGDRPVHYGTFNQLYVIDA